jgi:hypothetical protein
LAGVFVVLGIMFVIAVQPECRGGRVLTSVLAVAIGLVATLLLRALTSDESLTRDDADDDLPLKLDERQDVKWMTILLATILTAGLFLAVAFLGIVVGLTIAVFAVLWLRMKVPLRTAAPLALIWGVAIPIAFGTILEVAMWPGLIPELIPRWVGGGLLPPL